MCDTEGVVLVLIEGEQQGRKKFNEHPDQRLTHKLIRLDEEPTQCMF